MRHFILLLLCLALLGFGLASARAAVELGQFNHTNISMSAYWARLMLDAGL